VINVIWYNETVIQNLGLQKSARQVLLHIVDSILSNNYLVLTNQRCV